MKKTLSLALALVMAMSLSVPAFATEIGVGDTQSANTTVTYGPSSSYTVIIPDSVNIPFVVGNGDAASMEISAKDVMINYGETLNITITGQESGKWLLVDTSDASNTVEYIIGTDAGKSDIVEGTNVLAAPAGEYWDSTLTETLHLTVNENVEKTGSYSDIITFGVSVD